METSDSPLSVEIARTLQASATAGPPSLAGDIVVDGFESGDFSAPGYPKFAWGGATDVRFVGSSPEYQAKTGKNCMVIRYPAGTRFIEQNFHIAAPGANDLWMAFDMRVPPNYYHVDIPDSVKENQKFFRLWCTTYSGYSDPGGGTKLGMEFRPTYDKDGSSYYYCKLMSKFENGADMNTNPKTTFISVPEDLGKWMSFVFHFKLSSEFGANDGVFEVWRKREGETDYTKEFEFLNRGMPPATNGEGVGLAHADFMGYANVPYTEDTEFLFDNFVLSTRPLMGLSSASGAL